MKYQIYLNKKTSEVINALAKMDNEKPATYLKRYLEVSFAIAMKKAQEVIDDADLLDKAVKQGD